MTIIISLSFLGRKANNILAMKTSLQMTLFGKNVWHYGGRGRGAKLMQWHYYSNIRSSDQSPEHLTYSKPK